MTEAAAQEVRCVILDATQRSKFQQQMCCLLFILAQSFLHSSNDAKPPNALLHKFNGVPQPPPATSTAIKAIMMEGNQPNFQNYVCCQLKYKISLGGVFWKQNLNFTPNGVKVSRVWLIPQKQFQCLQSRRNAVRWSGDGEQRGA